MAQRSAGVLAYRRRQHGIEVFLVHPGGPYWKNKEDGAWSIPKGLYANEEPLAAARREFEEETGLTVEGRFIPLGDFKQPGGKIVTAFAVEAELDAGLIRSNRFEMEWPPRSGTRQLFPEVDRAAWFSIETAERKIHKGQVPLLRALVEKLAG